MSQYIQDSHHVHCWPGIIINIAPFHGQHSVLYWMAGYMVMQLTACFTHRIEQNGSKLGFGKFMRKDQSWVLKAN